MNKEVIKELLYGGIAELIKNRNFYYHSTVGPNYCHFTEEGKEALQEYMNLLAYKMAEAEEASLNTRAKELVVKGLKGEKI